jgi:hypothetical protein
MTIGGILILILVILGGGWLAHWVITSFFPPQMHMPLLAVVGVILLVTLVFYFWPQIFSQRIG